MNELSISKEKFLKETQANGLGELLKPFIKEIFLLDTYVADILFMHDLPITDLKEGDELLLRREKTDYSDYTVAVLKKDGFRLGELPDSYEEIFARMLDAGKALKAKIRSINITSEYQTLIISVFLLDF